jgi:hypothetical protein
MNNAGQTKPGILLMTHGGNETRKRSVATLVEPLREKYAIETVADVKQQSAMAEAVRQLEERDVDRVAVVGLFITGQSFLKRIIKMLGSGSIQEQSLAGESGSGCTPLTVPFAAKSTLLLSTKGLIESPLIDEILVERVRALSEEPRCERVLFLAHGPADDEENQRWLEEMNARAERIREAEPFREVRCETLREDWPEKRAVSEKRIREFVKESVDNGERVIVVPFRVYGFGPYEKVLDGLDYVADGRGLTPHPNITRWIEVTAEACFADQSHGTQG